MTTRTQHTPEVGPTPGPWTVENDGFGDYVMAGGKEIFNPDRDESDEDTANARLIAAAPDLLAACKALAERGAVIATTGLGEQLRAAIAKAESR